MPSYIHIPEWIERAAPDYYTLFIQSWIPYNAWYNREIVPHAGKSDKECIAYMCDHPNDYKNKIISLLSTDDEDGAQFRKDVAQLHNALLSHTIPEIGRRISFSTMSQGNIAEHLVQQNYYSYHYKVERIPVGDDNTYDILVDDISTHAIKYTTHLGRRQNFDAVEHDSDFQNLSLTIQKKIREYFAKVNPNAPFDVVLQPIQRGSESLPPFNCLVMDAKSHTYFVNDKDKVAQILIRLIYKLRCELFHGSINPKTANIDVFKYLFKVQSRLIKELA